MNFIAHCMAGLALGWAAGTGIKGTGNVVNWLPSIVCALISIAFSQAHKSK